MKPYRTVHRSRAPEDTNRTTDDASERALRVLFVSSMIVSPKTGGGNTTVNLLETESPGMEVFYATPKHHPPHLHLFPELTPRMCEFDNGRFPLPLLPEAKFGLVRWLNERVISPPNKWFQKEQVIRDIVRCVGELEIDVLLVCPQNTWIDTAVAPELVQRTGLPSVAWFMDDYYEDERSRRLVGEIWGNARHRFVISESMRELFSARYGGEAGVLNNSVPFPERYPEPAADGGSRLRIVYAGSMNPYYQDTVSKVLRELEGLGDRVALDIYSPDKLPAEWQHKTDVAWRHLPPVPPTEVGKLLQSYDVLLLLSSFQPRWREVAETAQAGKMADYLAAGRCVLAYGPEYAENVRYLERHGIGEVVASSEPGALRDAVLSLAQDPGRRRCVGERAYHFGRERRDKARNSARLWRALQEASASPPARQTRQTAVWDWLRNVTFRTLHALGVLKKGIRWIVKRKSNATGKG